MSLVERFTANIARVGETLAFTTYGGVVVAANVAGICRMADSGTLRTYLDDIELLAVTHPGVLITVADTSTVAVNDVFVREGRSFVVFKVWKHRIGGVVVCVQAIAA
jgi:hypothetical protein